MILIIDDDIAVRTSLSLLLKQSGFKAIAAENPKDGLMLFTENSISLVLLDMNFSIETTGKEGLQTLRNLKKINPTIPIILMTGWGSIALAVEGMKSGAADFVNKPWSNQHLLQTINTSLNLNGEKELSLSRKELNQKYGFENIIGEDPKLLAILKTIGRISTTDASVLIMGESGTGKELIAEAIHRNSNRRNKPFVKVNLGGISSSLFESEMFGHKRGAFTDAKLDRVGRFEMANKGTIFLDEIGDLELNSQVKLLRVLQDRTYEVLGDSKPRAVDVRVVSATNKNLPEIVNESKFREDLYYRINLITVNLPPLRERSADIPLLINHFINNLKTIYNRPDLSVSKKACNWLKQLPLPGNIRELKNLVERTVLVSEKNMLEVGDFECQIQSSPKPTVSALPAIGSMTLEEIELSMIKKAMEVYNGNISKVAKSLGLSRGTLYRRLEKFDIPFEDEDKN
jgi:two-component system, NtrC family, response regulator